MTAANIIVNLKTLIDVHHELTVVLVLVAVVIVLQLVVLWRQRR